MAGISPVLGLLSKLLTKALPSSELLYGSSLCSEPERLPASLAEFPGPESMPGMSNDAGRQTSLKLSIHHRTKSHYALFLHSEINGYYNISSNQTITAALTEHWPSDS